jgi:hypothetical protein
MQLVFAQVVASLIRGYLCLQGCLLSNDVGRRRFGLSIINTTKVDMFTRQQQAELFRLKGRFCEVLEGEFYSDAFKMYSFAVQGNPSFAKGWLSWGQFLERCAPCCFDR